MPSPIDWLTNGWGESIGDGGDKSRPTSVYADSPMISSADERVFGWDPMAGIVSVWANREGRAVVWRREQGRIVCSTEYFRPWLFATSLADLSHLGSSLVPATATGADNALVNYRELDGPDGSYRYVLSARDGRALERMLLTGARGG